jgi:hypothetical protein
MVLFYKKPNFNIMSKGYIYCLSNPSFVANTYKIGFTNKAPTIRAMELYKTGLPTPFRIEFSKRVKNARIMEHKLHCMFKKYRINDEREFFALPMEKIRKGFESIQGQWWEEGSVKKVESKTIDTKAEAWSLKQRRLRRKCKVKSSA